MAAIIKIAAPCPRQIRDYNMNMENIHYFNYILQSFNINASCVNYQHIDNYFFYDISLNHNTRVKEIEKFTDELSLAMRTPCKPNLKVLHQEGVVRLEFVSPRTTKLDLFDYFTNDDVPQGDVTCLLGQSIDGKRVWMDLSKNPHLIVAGTTGSGKSTLLHNVIANLFNYNKVKLFLIDPKNVEFSTYDGHMSNTHVSYTYAEAIWILDSLLSVMEERYEMMRKGYNDKLFPYIVLMIDEFGDLIMQDQNHQFYKKLCKLAQKCRAARISIILSTQRPSATIIDGNIKANFPARIACRATSQIDSKIILDSSGAENLLGKGDALIKDNQRHLERFQIAYTEASEVCKYFGDL